MNPAVILGCAIGVAPTSCDRPTEPSSPASSTPIGTAVPTPTPSPSSAMATPSAAPVPGALKEGASPPAVEDVTFDSEPAGAPSSSFDAVVGDWYVAAEGGVIGFKVDGGRWRSGVPSANLADQAKRLYGDRYAEFLAGVKAFAFFPLAVWKHDPPPGDITVSVRFLPLAGKVDQAAGIAFAIAPNGSYLGIRANALEDDILYFRVVKGKRTVVDDLRNVPTATNKWHALSLEIRGSRVVATLDGLKRFDKTLDSAPVGKIGLWSKADSQVLFDDFNVTRVAP